MALPRIQATLFIALRPVIARMLAKALNLKPDSAQRSLDRIHRVLDELEPRIADRRYLVGDRFTAADLSFACMLAPTILPSPAEGYGGYLPPPDRIAAPAAELALEVRDRPAGRFVLRLFAEERGKRIVPVNPPLEG